MRTACYSLLALLIAVNAQDVSNTNSTTGAGNSTSPAVVAPDVCTPSADRTCPVESPSASDTSSAPASTSADQRPPPPPAAAQSTGSAPGAPFSFVVQPIANPAETHTFVPFPAPTEKPVSGVFEEFDPSNPPPVGSTVIPDFHPAWDAAIEKAKAKLAEFTLEEKVNVTTGVGWTGGRCVGNIPSLDGKGWPGLCLEDSPLGVRFADFVTVFPTGVNTAATWNRKMIRARGLAMGKEFKGKGVHVALGPMMNIGRVAAGGRNWEGFGADPFLAGEASYETILGMQNAGVQACAKHLVANEQEHARTTSSSNLEDRTMHEIYSHPFLRSVQAGVASVMCSYNLINGTWACENDKVQNDILKREYGFQGYIMSDWQATHTTLSSIEGLDMTMPGDIVFNSGDSYFGGNLTTYVRNSSVPENRLDDMATRIMAAWYLLKQDDPSYPKVNFDAFKPLDEANNEHVDVQEDHYKIVREIGAASTVLLKNNGALPLNKPRSIALIGLDAGPQPGGPNQFPDQGGNAGILGIGWGSGTANFPYLISPYEAIQARARKDRTSVNWNFNNWDTVAASNIAIQQDVAMVFINSDSGEEYITVDGNQGDRNNLTAWHNGDNLVLAVAAKNKNTVVVVHSVGPMMMEQWIDHPNVTAVVWAGAAGQETGNSLVDVIYGDWNPSGRLPYTIAKKPEDYSASVAYGQPKDIYYTEALNVDYRHFDTNNIAPRFEFGFGLSYTSFEYSNLNVTKIQSKANPDLSGRWEQSLPSPNGDGSSAATWLHEPAYVLTFTVKNTGSFFGSEIPQVYINHPTSAGEPPSILKGFNNVEVAPGKVEMVTITLSRYDLSIWDVVSQSWMRPQGTIKFTVSASSRDHRLTGQIPV